MSPDLERDQRVVDIHQRPEIHFVQHLVDAEQFGLGQPGPVEHCRGPMDEDPFQGLGWCQANRTVLGDIGEGLADGAHHRGMDKRWIVVIYGQEFDHVVTGIRLAPFPG